MNIIFSNYDDIYNPYYGGGGAYAIYEIAKRLAPKNNVSIITGKYPGCKNEIIDGIYFKRIGFKNMGPKIGQIIFQILLPLHVIFSKFDVWIESFTPPWSTAFLPLFTSKPVIGLTQLLGGKDMKNKYSLPFDKIEKFGLQKYKSVITLNSKLKEDLLEINPNLNVKIIPNGVNNSLIKANVHKNNNSNYMLYLGRIDYDQKGLDLLLESYKLIEKEINLLLYIVGTGNKTDLKKFNDKIESLLLKDKIKQFGRVTGNDKYKLLENSAFLLTPSRHESFGLVVLEAFCYKNPVITFDIEGFNWIPSNCGLKAKCFDTKEYSMKILELAKNSNLRVRMGENGKKFAQNYDWDLLSQQYMNFIKEVTKYNE